MPLSLVADLFLFCYERDFMKSLTKEKRYDMIDAFVQLLDTWTIYSISIIFTLKDDSQNIYPAELQLNKANASDTEAAF